MRDTGVLGSQHIRDLITQGHISSTSEITQDNIQPSSLDLRLGAKAYRIRASFLPGSGETVLDRLKADDLVLYEFHLNGEDGAVLETDSIYIIPLQESLSLPSDISAISNPKSSTGRLDVFTRVIGDGCNEFECMPGGYNGQLYLEIAPKTFQIKVREGDTLTQMLFKKGNARLTDIDIESLHQAEPLVYDEQEKPIPVTANKGVCMSVDLSHDGVVGYRARKHAPVIDLRKKNHYPLSQFWEPIYAHNQSIILDPGEFYILSSAEKIAVPPQYACEMIAYDVSVGEFRAHYAGFFDPGFGHGDHLGSYAVLEVRAHDVPFVLRHGQTVCRMAYDHMLEVPDKIYGTSIKSNYQGQKLKLGKQFRLDDYESWQA